MPSGYKKTHEQFVDEINQLTNEEYEVLGIYIKGSEKVSIKHNVCGNIWDITPRDFLSGRRCPICSRKLAGIKNAKSHEWFLEEFYKIFSINDYEILSEYINTHKKIKVLHKVCGYVFYSPPCTLLKSLGCPKCSGRLPYTTETFSIKVSELTNNEYTLLSEYKNNKTKVLIKHNTCGHEYKVKPCTFIIGCRCPNCKLSKGEKKIEKYLFNNKKIFDPQYRFNDCKDKKPLPFDFAILDQNNYLVSLIEYDGHLHFMSVSYFEVIKLLIIIKDMIT